jgi:hypothetical protein
MSQGQTVIGAIKIVCAAVFEVGSHDGDETTLFHAAVKPDEKGVDFFRASQVLQEIGNEFP